MRDYSDQRGLRNPMARLPDSAVRKARELYRPGVFGYDRVANTLGVNKTTARQWLNGTTRAQA